MTTTMRLFPFAIAAILLNGCGKSDPLRTGGKPVSYWVQAVHDPDVQVRLVAYSRCKPSLPLVYH